jgi:hypothetical protein
MGWVTFLCKEFFHRVDSGRGSRLLERARSGVSMIRSDAFLWENADGDDIVVAD